MRFLIADGAAAVRSALRLLLLENRLGEILEAQNVREIEHLIQDNAVDIALIDWNLRFGSGSSAIQIIRQHQPHVVIVILSGRPETQQRALEAGADAFVSKGDPPEALLSTINALACKGVERSQLDPWKHRACLSPQPSLSRVSA
jgi:DNA-binding NarL/FixJ family response regulator